MKTLRKQEIDGYDRLAQAIVRQAIYDLNHGKKNQRDDARGFFLSNWFTELTGFKGEEVLAKLGEE